MVDEVPRVTIFDFELVWNLVYACGVSVHLLGRGEEDRAEHQELANCSCL